MVYTFDLHCKFSLVLQGFKPAEPCHALDHAVTCIVSFLYLLHLIYYKVTFYTRQGRYRQNSLFFFPIFWYISYSSLAHPCNQISGSHENLITWMCEGSAILWAKMSCKAAESHEVAFLRMARMNCTVHSYILVIGFYARMKICLRKWTKNDLLSYKLCFK